MVKIEIVESLYYVIDKKFQKDAIKVYELIESLKISPNKGKLLGVVGGIIIKQLKFKNFRFYFLADGFKLKFLSQNDLTDLLLKFVRMSDKKHQQITINEIKQILIKIGPSGFK